VQFGAIFAQKCRIAPSHFSRCLRISQYIFCTFIFRLNKNTNYSKCMVIFVYSMGHISAVNFHVTSHKSTLFSLVWAFINIVLILSGRCWSISTVIQTMFWKVLKLTTQLKIVHVNALVMVLAQRVIVLVIYIGVESTVV